MSIILFFSPQIKRKSIEQPKTPKIFWLKFATIRAFTPTHKDCYENFSYRYRRT
ncbi:hypothetical protein [Moraxella lacunata]|uniref:hypothetical protein n=1 Tax=Moraxella lacunata TaxID=477 RepID=UPI003EE26E92